MRPSPSLLAALLAGSVAPNGFAQPATAPPPAGTAAPATPAPAPAPAPPPAPSAAPNGTSEPPPATDQSAPAEPTEAAEGAAPASKREPAGPPAAPAAGEDEALPPLVPAAPDTLGGHLNLALGAALAVPFGRLESSVPVNDVMGPGFALTADLGLGVSRRVVLGLWGQLALLGEGDDCTDFDTNESCKAKSYAGGLFVGYHLVQGVRFDPWISAGLGYRVTKLEPIDVSYSGFELARLQVGGDWYALSNFGIGALLELDMGIYGDRSKGSLGDAAAHWQFLTGLRLVFDVPGK